MTGTDIKNGLKLVWILLAGAALSGCCHGQWCVGAMPDKKLGVPPPANLDDRTHGVDPRTTGPAEKNPAPKRSDPEHEVLTQ
jgi:hypothetical protein